MAGVTTGVITGLVPGIHPNTVVFASLPYYFRFQPGLELYLVFIAGLSISHTFHDFLPAIFLHAPNSSTALSTLPGAEAVEKGEGLKAFYRTASGGLIAITSVLILLPVLLLVLKPLYSLLQPLMLYILIYFLIYTVLKQGNVLKNLQLAAVAGLLGIYSFNMPVNQNFVLIPVFSGLFAVPSMLDVFGEEHDLPPQNKEFEADISPRSGFTGALSGLLAGIVPGIGPAISTSFLSPLSEDEGFITALGGVNSSDIVTSLVALYILNRPRSGASVAINQVTSLSAELMAVLIGVSLLAAALSFLIATRISRYFVKFIEMADYRLVVSVVLAVITGLTFHFLGVLGLLVLFTSSAIGFAARAVGQRAVLMAVLIVPAILSFSGVGVVM